MKIINRPPSQITYVEVPASSSSSPIDILGSNNRAANVVLGVFPGDLASVVFGDVDVSLGDTMALSGTEVFTIAPDSRYLILENRSTTAPLRVSYYVY